MTQSIALLYALFSAISTAINIGAQAIVVVVARHGGLHDTLTLPSSVIVGTGLGLVSKYVLDKKWIFQYKAANPKDEARAFALYTAMGILTTLIYLGTEFSFHWAFKTDAMRYAGGAFGLGLGYYMKYFLDKKYSFRKI